MAVRKKQTIYILRCIYEQRMAGEAFPVRKAFDLSDGSISENDWFCTARLAGFNVVLRNTKGTPSWYEGEDINDLRGDEVEILD